VHRDVKPQNVLLTPDGEAKMTDFGIARSLDVEHGVTQTGTVLGTSNYLSPEQASGKPVTPATDVYSLGVVMFELLSAEVPFPGDTFVAVAMKHINDPPPDLRELRPDVPLRLVAAIERALEKDPARRFGSMDEFAWELKQCYVEMGAPDAERTFIAPSPVIRESRRRPVRAARRRRWPIYALILVAVAAAIVAAVLLLGGSNDKNANGGSTAATSTPLPLNGIGAYDPEGGDGEHDSVAYRATDGDLTTYWDTEHYNTFQKRGVGVVLDAGRAANAKTMTVKSDTPGFTASILAGNSPSGPFATDSASQTVNASATYTLHNRTARYYVVWITNLGSNVSVHVNEVHARK
jgi:serine/threonine-protein kinase